MQEILLDKTIIQSINEICLATGLRPDYVISRGLVLFVDEYNAELKKLEETIQQKVRN